MDVQYAWGWEMSQMVYLYTQLYVMPLVLMLVLSAMTIYRREMSCNRVYHSLEGGELGSPERQQQTPQHESTALASLFAPILWFQFDRGSLPEDSSMSENAHTRSSRPDEPQRPTTRDPLEVVVSDILSLQWSEDAKQALIAMHADLMQRVLQRLSEATSIVIPRHQTERLATPLHPDKFPADVQVNIMSFLHPKDVATFACASKACQNIVDGDGPTPRAVWKNLWQRDYGFIMQSWKFGRQALLRSNVIEPRHGKDFYFRFGLSYVDYLLAGLNTPDHCFVGLHGSIYDLTDFVIRHPGSPETLFVHAGRDATDLFDDMNHTKGARRLAKEFCIAENVSSCGSHGLRPTVEFPSDRSLPAIVEAKAVIGKKERQLRRPKCLQKIYEDFMAEKSKKHRDFSTKMNADVDVLHWMLYYDPYQISWKVWYTNIDFETVFV